LPDAANDPFYAIISPAQQAVVINTANIPASYIPNDPNSRWIWEDQFGQPTNTTRTFRTTFNIPVAFDLTSAVIVGRWSVDNYGLDILFNGNSTGQTAAGFGSWTSFNFNNLFVYGQNTVDFVVQDVGFISGLRVEFLDSNIERLKGTDAPEPGTFALAGFGLAAAAWFRRRSRSA